MTRSARPANSADTTLGSGIESGIVLVLFVAAGFGLDAWLGTKPIFTLVLFAIGAVGLFYRYKAAYSIRMEAHEAERRARLESRQSGRHSPDDHSPDDHSTDQSTDLRSTDLRTTDHHTTDERT